MEATPASADERFAEWYVWAKREVGTDVRICLGAAQAAIEALEAGADEPGARKAARRSVAGHGIALVSRIPPRRRAYAEWYDWARREIGGSSLRLHTATRAAIGRLDSGGDAAHAAAAARAAVGPVETTAGTVAGSTPLGDQRPANPAPAVPPAAAAPFSGSLAGVAGPLAGEQAQRSPAGLPALSPPYPYLPPQPVTFPPPAPVAPSHAYAGFWRRLGAWFIDALLLAVGVFVLLIVVLIFALIGLASSGQPATDQNLGAVQLVAYGIALVLFWLYFAGLESSVWQATIGKRLMGLVVTDVHGRRISFGRATARYFAKIVSTLTLLVGYLLIGVTQRKQGLHDMMAGTLVARRLHLSLLTAPVPPAVPQGRPGGAGEVQQGA